MEDSYSRFSRVAENYRLYRPHYPQQLVEFLNAECDLTPDQIIADIGSGTGLLTELFVENGNTVYGVEPNLEMRSAAEHLLHAYPVFKSIAATAEATTLADHSVNMITAGQAFHWFKHDLARQEFLRILVPNGWVVLVWNLERNNGTPFDIAFEQFWHKYLRSRPQWGEHKRPDYVTEFYSPATITEKTLDNYQICDFEVLKGRVLSSSYSPQPDDPRYSDMLDELVTIFDQYQEAGTVRLEYDTQIVYGKLSE